MAPRFLLFFLSLLGQTPYLSMPYFSVFLNASVYIDLALGKAVNRIITYQEVTT
jgi:hypothetical protein